MPKALKLYRVEPSSFPADAALQIRAARGSEEHPGQRGRTVLYIVSTSKQAAADAAKDAGVPGLWAESMEIVYQGKVGEVLLEDGYMTEAGAVYAFERWPVDRDPIVKWVPGVDDDSGEWKSVGRIDLRERPRFSLTALWKLDLEDYSEVQAFFDKLGVVVRNE